VFYRLLCSKFLLTQDKVVAVGVWWRYGAIEKKKNTE